MLTNKRMETLKDIAKLSETLSEDGLNARVFEAIRKGTLPLSVFLDYQNMTQTDVRDCLGGLLF